MNGWRLSFTSLLVEIFTTEGIALRAARLYELTALPATGASSLGWGCPRDSVIGRTPPALRPVNRSGRRVCTTRRIPKAMVVAWGKASQILRIGRAAINPRNLYRETVDAKAKLYAGT